PAGERGAGSGRRRGRHRGTGREVVGARVAAGDAGLHVARDRSAAAATLRHGKGPRSGPGERRGAREGREDEEEKRERGESLGHGSSIGRSAAGLKRGGGDDAHPGPRRAWPDLPIRGLSARVSPSTPLRRWRQEMAFPISRRAGIAVLAVAVTAFVGAVPASGTAPGSNGRIAFARGIRHVRILYVEPDGSHRHALTSASGVRSDPAWSPNGSRLAAEHVTSGHSAIFTM